MGRAESSTRKCERCGEALAATGWRPYDPIDLVGATVLGILLVGLLVLFGFLFSPAEDGRRVLHYFLMGFILLPYGLSKLIGRRRSARFCPRCRADDGPATAC